MANRLTDEEELAFIRSNELLDYADYIESTVRFGGWETELPLTFGEWLGANCPEQGCSIFV